MAAMTLASAPALAPGSLDLLRGLDLAREIERPAAGLARLWEDARLLAGARVEEALTAMMVRRVARHAGDRDGLIRAMQSLPPRRRGWANEKWVPPADARGNRAGTVAPVADMATDAYWLNRAPSNRGLLVFLPATSFIMPAGAKQVRALQSFASRFGISAMLLHYPLAPEHPFPAAPERVAADYRALLETHDFCADEIVLAAASSGASVGLGALQLARDAGLPMPAGLLLFSPWVDLTLSSWSYVTRGLTLQTPMRLEFVAFCARLYLGDKLPITPLASPLFANMTGWPPTLVHASRRDLYFDDGVRLVQRLHENDRQARINYWDHPQHFLEQFTTPEAQASLQLAADFIRERLDG